MRSGVSFYSEGRKLAGHLYLPHSTGQPLKAIVLCHGFAGIKELLLPPYAEEFAAAGFAALVFDYRGFGESEGDRGRLVPDEQVADIRNAITWMQAREDINRDAIALWGTSFGGANAITAAALDPRVKCVCAQITFASGRKMVLGNQDEAGKTRVLSTLQKVWEREVITNKSMMLAPDQILTDGDSKAFFAKMTDRYPALKTKIPFRTLKHIIEFSPQEAIRAVEVPVCIIAAEADIVCPPEESRRLFDSANEPKELFIISAARHFQVYEGQYCRASCGKALEWFRKYL